MVKVAVNFTHHEYTCKKGDEFPDDHDLVKLAPHLFDLPEPEPEPHPSNRRIRGPLVEPVSKTRSSKNKEA